MELLKKIYRRIREQARYKNYAKYVGFNSYSIIESTFSIRVNNPLQNKKYVTCGENCMIGASFVFETEDGYVSIGNRTQISGGACLISRSGIEIGDDVTIAGGCLLYDHDSHSIYWSERKNDTIQQIKDYKATGDPLKNKNWKVVKSDKIVIEDKAWLGYGVTVLKGVRIGEGAVIGARSVVTHDIPAYSVAAGNPARVIKTIAEEKI